MKAMKKIFAVILVLSLVFTFSACGKKGDDTTTESSSPETTFAPTEYHSEWVTDAAVVTPPTTEPQTQATTQAPTESRTQATTQAPTEAPKPTTGVSNYKATYKGVEQSVYYPNSINASSTPLPVISWANGTGFSYTIYESLLREIAEGGYIVVANKETMSADGTAQIASLDFIISENSNPDSALYNKVNTSKLGVFGHSQGGRSSVNAAAKDSRILCAVSLAGSNFVEEAEALSTPTLFFTGTKDLIVGAERWVKPAYNACKGTAVYASLKDGVHTTCSTNPGVYSGYAIKWFDIYLKNDSSARSVFVNGGQLSQDGAWTDFQCKGI